MLNCWTIDVKYANFASDFEQFCVYGIRQWNVCVIKNRMNFVIEKT